MFSLNRVLHLIFHWKFIFAMTLAIGSRISFIIINNSLLKIPSLANNSTTITVFVTAISYIAIIIANYIFLKERISLQQGTGAIIILVGIWIMLK